MSIWMVIAEHEAFLVIEIVFERWFGLLSE